MHITRARVVELLRSQDRHDLAGRAEETLPPEVDLDGDTSALTALGIRLGELKEWVGATLAGGMGRPPLPA